MSFDLRGARHNRGLTLDEVAEQTGVAKNTLARAERGEGEPRPKAKLAIATFYDVLPTDIWPVAIDQEAAAA